LIDCNKDILIPLPIIEYYPKTNIEDKNDQEAIAILIDPKKNISSETT